MKGQGMQFLQKAMASLGKGVEKVLGQAKKAKATVEQKSGLAPILSLESRLSFPKLKQLIDLFGERFFLPALPTLKDKTILEMGETGLKFSAPILEKKPKVFCGLIVGEGSGSSPPGAATPGGTPPGATPLGGAPLGVSLCLKGSFKSIPFEDRFFDCILCRLATPKQGDVLTAMKEMGRILSPEGVGLILDYHPFGLYAKSGSQRLRSVQTTIRGIEDYFKMCKVAGLVIVDLHEGFIDDTLRNQFITPPEMAAFREIKGTPLVIFLKVMKARRV